MKKRKINLISIFLLTMFFVSCTNHPETSDSSTLKPIASPEPIRTATPVATVTPMPTETLSPTLTFEPTPTPEPTPIPEPNAACMYINYANSFSLVVTNDYSIEFHNDDTVTVTDDDDHFYEVSLAQSINAAECDLSDPDLWYFNGAFQFGNTVYAHYNYMSLTEKSPSLLIKINLGGESVDANLCILSYNPKKHFQNCFAVTSDFIYYTNTYYTNYGTATTDIIRTDKDGNNSSVFYTGALGDTIRYLTCDGRHLSYVITDLSGVHHLISTDLSTNTSTTLTDALAQPDFLIGWNGYILTSVQNNRLTYFDCMLGTHGSILFTENASVTTGYPLTDGTTLFLPLITYTGTSATVLLPLDLKLGTTQNPIQLDDSYYHSIGMIDEYLYAEDVDSFITFNITEQN